MLLHCDGTGAPCTRMNADKLVSRSPFAIWGCNSSDVVAVGSGGNIYHYKNSEWQPEDSGLGEVVLYGVWASACDDYYAVGDEGTILHYDGQTWKHMESGTTDHLRGIWGAGPGDIYAAGFGGTLLHFDGSRWSPVRTGTKQRFTGISGAINADGSVLSIVLVGESGTFLRLIRTNQ